MMRACMQMVSVLQKSFLRSGLFASLILSLVLAPTVSFATDPKVTSSHSIELNQVGEAPPVEAQPLTPQSPDFEVRFSQVVYSLKTLPQVIEDITVHHVNAAGGAITKKVTQEIEARFAAAVQLMAVIMQDTSMPERERAEKSMALAEALGVLLLKVIRQQGEEKVGLDGRIVDVAGAMGYLREFMLDVQNFVVPRQSADGRYVAGPFAQYERVRRDRLARTMIENLQQFAQNELPKLGDESRLRVASSKYWNIEILERAVKIRQTRVGNQRGAALAYLGMAFVVMVAPVVDSVGLVMGRDGNTLLMSSVLYASIWTSAWFIKTLAASKKTLGLLKDLHAFLNSEIAKVSEKRSLRKKIDESVKSSEEAMLGLRCEEYFKSL